MNFITLGVGAASGLTALAALTLLTFKVIPTWANSLNKSWKNINVFAAVVGIAGVLAALVPVFLGGISPQDAAFASVSTGVLAFCFTQACFTDPPLHLVDRRTLMAASAITFPFGACLLYGLAGNAMLGLYLVFCMVGAAFIFLPLGMGASDGRAFLLVCAASFPFLGLDLFKYALGGMFACFLLCGLAMKALKVRRSMSKGEGLGKSLVEKAYMPAVPMIIGPFLAAHLWVIFSILVK